MKQILKNNGMILLFILICGSIFLAANVTAYQTPSTTLIYGPKTALVPYLEYIENTTNAKIAVGPTGTVSVIFSGTWEEGHKVYYMDNATGSWSIPELLIDPAYVNHQANDIAVDTEGDVHIFTNDASSGYYITNKTSDGSWFNKTFPGGLLGYKIFTDPTGHIIYTISFDDGMFRYTNISFMSPENINVTSKKIDFPSYLGINSTFDPDIVMNSTYDAHIVFSANSNIYYMTISPTGIRSEPRKVSMLNGVYGSMAETPDLAIDSADQLHLIYRKTVQLSDGSWDRALTGIYYEQLNATSDGTSAIKVAEYPGGRPFIAVGNDDSLAIGSSRTVEVGQIQYATNREGSWSSEIISSFSHSIYGSDTGVYDFDINPLTNDGVILSVYGGRMELIIQKGGYWGSIIEYSTNISAMQVQYPEDFVLSMNLTNTGPYNRNFSTAVKIACLETIDFKNTEGNLQSVGFMTVNDLINFTWNMHFTGQFQGQIHITFLVDETVDDRGYFGVYYDIAVTISIPGPEVVLLLICSALGTITILVRKQHSYSILITH